MTLDHFFTESVRRFPHRRALFSCGRCWSYAELDAESQSIEQELSARGLRGAHSNIGVFYGRGALSYAAVIAIMRTGNVYVPLNNKAPADRLCKVLQDAGIGVLIVDTSEGLLENLAGALESTTPLALIARDDDTVSSLQAAVERSRHSLHLASPRRAGAALRIPESAPGRANALAYIIYTSGSTGVPKGVAITHASACSCIEKVHRLVETHEEDRFSEFSALSFDVSISDLFLCWKSGGALYVPSASEAMVPLSFVVKHRITVWSSVPSLASFLQKLRLLQPGALSSVRVTMFCGEALPCELAHAWAVAAPDSRVLNIYGPTECTIFATYFDYDGRHGPRCGVVPIGRTLPGLRHLIVNDGVVVDAEDVAGELWLTGDQLAAEYWRNPAATSASFVPHPSGEGAPELWYRTGDLVSYRSDVGLCFHGRIDRQVKLRGYRIELQEVESILRDIIGCARVAVIPVRGAGGLCEKLIAYCDGPPIDENAVKSRGASRMAPYMVPERIIQLDDLPVSAHGKIDYRALAGIGESAPIAVSTRAS